MFKIRITNNKEFVENIKVISQLTNKIELHIMNETININGMSDNHIVGYSWTIDYYNTFGPINEKYTINVKDLNEGLKTIKLAKTNSLYLIINDNDLILTNRDKELKFSINILDEKLNSVTFNDDFIDTDTTLNVIGKQLRNVLSILDSETVTVYNSKNHLHFANEYVDLAIKTNTDYPSRSIYTVKYLKLLSNIKFDSNVMIGFSYAKPLFLMYKDITFFIAGRLE